MLVCVSTMSSSKKDLVELLLQDFRKMRDKLNTLEVLVTVTTMSGVAKQTITSKIIDLMEMLSNTEDALK